MVRMDVSRGEGNKAFKRVTIKKADSVPLPFLVLRFFIAFVNRVNTSVAALQMNTNPKRSDPAFGVGAIIR